MRSKSFQPRRAVVLPAKSDFAFNVVGALVVENVASFDEELGMTAELNENK